MGESASLASMALSASFTANPFTPESSNAMPQTRGYQQEMLDDSLHRNIIIALDTGSGKTLIAILRMKHEAEREPTKISWFFAPTVALCEQQKSVIQMYLPVSVGLISGALEPTQWKDASLWTRVLRTHRIMVSTPQVFLDALRHGYIVLGRDIGLLVFDEAHHAVDNHPYNRIMQEFYFDLPPRERNLGHGSKAFVRPMVLGLTASPIYGGNVQQAFATIERNLDSTIRAPRRYRDELAKFVHRPIFKHILYQPLDSCNPPFSTNYASLCAVLETINIEDDPYVKSLRKQLSRTTALSSEYHRADQKLSKVIAKQDSFTHRGLRDFARAAKDICMDLGAWAADWYVYTVLMKARRAANPYNNIMSTWKDSEKVYLLSILDKVVVSPVSYYPDDIMDDVSDKLRVLISCLLEEKAEAEAEAHDDAYSGLIFVERRDTVLALRELLRVHPFTKDVFHTGILLGSSESAYRHSFLDITRHLTDDVQEETLSGFRIGEKNLIVSTSVAEEGIDIQACGSVIRWDPPQNMASWVQSRGRARRQRSTFTLLFEDGAKQREDVQKWERVEREMVALYNDAQRDLRAVEDDEVEDEDEDDDLEFRVESTGALLTIHSAISHLSHFCAVIPSRVHVDNRPLYDIDPPEYPEGWHAFDRRSARDPYEGPYGSKVTLPRSLPLQVREFRVETIYKTKISAHRHAAFFAYKALYDAGLLNESLLPITSIRQPHLEEEVKAMLADVEKRSGTAKVSLQMDPWAAEDDSNKFWWSSELKIDGLPPLCLFTRSKPAEISIDDGHFLYRPLCDRQSFTLRTSQVIHDLDERINRAREYTRRIFWCLNGSRMDWNNCDFCYLFLPCDTSYDHSWISRRSWLAKLGESTNRGEKGGFFANAELFGKEFNYPNDLTIVNNGLNFAKALRFVRWRFDKLSPEEELDVKAYYEKRIPDLEITYPLLVVQTFPPRTNFLLPLAPKDESPPERPETFLIPRLSSVPLLSFFDIEYAFLLPSVIRSLSMTITMDSLRRNLFPESSSMTKMPIRLLKMAMTAPITSERINYQRLETLGDTVLKFLSGVQLLGEYPLWHEGYLTKGKDHAVSNVRLAKENITRRLYSWIIRDRMLGKKWEPNYATLLVVSSEPGKEEESDTQNEKKKQDLSTKVLADVVESLIGAAYLHGGFSLGYECAKFFDLGLRWDTLPTRVSQLVSQVSADPDNLPLQLTNVEEMIGYTFTHKMLLIEALTHASYQDDILTPSYERLEFLGDSVLDMVVTDYLYHAPGKEYSPGHIHLRRSAIVNGHTLAYICLRTSLKVAAIMPRATGDGQIAVEADDQDIYLWKCLLHSSPRVLEDQFNTFARYRRRHIEIEEMLKDGTVFPWASLTRLQAPKFFSDMIESLIGAVFLDSGGSISTARSIMQRLGITQIMERIVRDDVDVLHPVSRMSLWAQKREKELEYVFVREKGNVSCVLLVNGVEEARVTDLYRGKASQEEVKYAAAEMVIKAFHLRDVDVNYSLMKKKKSRPKKIKVKTGKGKGKKK